MGTLHGMSRPSEPMKRGIMGVAAALCVLGLASLFWLHDYAGMSAAALPSAVASDERASASAHRNAPAASGVPSAESVFGGTSYIAPEEPIAQF